MFTWFLIAFKVLVHSCNIDGDCMAELFTLAISTVTAWLKHRGWRRAANGGELEALRIRVFKILISGLYRSVLEALYQRN
ncbi:hypothetical protein Bca101_009843 [Brassica carinata]